ncbi:VCBS repeat-containing protein [Gramella sp. AN32]|uniref:VCBS repeat-containing protein n=1 Tax=Christiangramia antarctica TaxID=2058158 RepID=A0ABW5X863_9FLAO
MRSIKSRYPVFIFILFLILSCKKDEKKEEAPLFFSNPKSEQTGVDFTNILTNSRDQNILDYLYFYNGGGVSIGDINNDGLPDIYFTGNQVKNKLYLNEGDLKFKDISESAGVTGNSTWNTGCTMADVNGDGFLDMYVSAVVGVNGFNGYNELFINNGDLTFTESSKEYGLDLENYSSQAAFFDMDNDGDLDVYILNHAVHTADSFGPAEIRNNRNYESGDKLFRNDNNKFIDVSEAAGIYGGPNSYGLGLTTADFNNDGFTDIYVGNDFHEDDYYYINNGDGTFTEKLKVMFGHVSRFSMGNDAADINNDGFVDLITLDMLPEDEKVLKSSAGDDNVNLHAMRIETLGYHPQFTRNMLQMNQGGEFFSETALMNGVAATDWSWGPIFADLDQDGNQDLFITNGIPKRPNDLDYVKYTSNEEIQKKLDQSTLIDEEALNKMPSGKVTNYVFSGIGNGNFKDVSKQWFKNDSVISTGLAYGDLDNDGDLDIVTNNINDQASIYINDEAKGNYLKLRLKGSGKNTFGIGARAVLFSEGQKQTRQLYTTKSFQSSSEPVIHFGIEKGNVVDSLILIWPGQKTEVVRNLRLNSTITLNELYASNSISIDNIFKKPVKNWFEKAENDLGLSYKHEENPFVDFNVQKLIPHQISDLGPAVKVADLNADGSDDVIFGGSRFHPAEIYLQKNGKFQKTKTPEISKDSLTEDVSAAVADFNQDGIMDIFIASGGGESVHQNEYLLDRLYLGNKERGFVRDSLFPKMYSNSSVVKLADYDDDGDGDIFIGSNSVNYDYGAQPTSYLLNNHEGKFSIVQNEGLFEGLGMVNDAIWTDFDNDSDLDLVVVGEWMSPKFIQNENGKFTDVTKNHVSGSLNGMWQSISEFDIDGDGDNDYMLGNWGLNTKLKASEKYPLLMYYKDFDKNGLTETLIASEKNGNYYFLYGKDELASQLSEKIRKKYSNYKDFAGQKADEIFSKDELNSAIKFEINELSSGYLKNEEGQFRFIPFERELQVAPIRSMLVYDFNKDGKEELLIGGNYFGITPYHGKFDAFGGAIIINEDNILNSVEIGLNLSQKSVKDFSVIKLNNIKYLLVTLNNAKTELYKIK